MNRRTTSQIVSPLPKTPTVAWPVRWLGQVTGWIGDTLCKQAGRITLLASSVLLVALQAVRPSTWRRTVRDETIRQCYFTGLHGLWFVAVIATLVGLGFVPQLLYWTSLAGENQYVGTFLSFVLVRELSPLLAALIVLGRSGTAIVTEIGAMRLNGGVEMIESAGVDPIGYLAVSRAVGLAISTLVLTVWLNLVALTTGYLAAVGLDLTNLTVSQFTNQVLGAMDVPIYIAVLCKSLLIGWVLGIICTMHGLQCTDNVPRLVPRCFTDCLLTAFIISGAISLIVS